MKTKQKIINQAIASFNVAGIKNVTNRDLAKSLGISSGNLDYHFKNKEELLKAIYQKMREEITINYEEKNNSTNPFINFNELLLSLESFQIKYSFFNLDVLEISRNFPEVNTLLKSTLLIRKNQMTHFFRLFMEKKYFKDELSSGRYMRLQHTIRILITFWKSQQEVLAHFTSAQNCNMTTYIWELLIPHMTKKGLNSYNSLTLVNTEKI